jgi:hypothetical protein
MELTPLKECVKGRVYRLRCRNLRVGVFDGKDGFIGIRVKFSQRFLFTEYHWEQGPPFGTVAGAVDMEIDVPDDIEVVESLGTSDKNTDRLVKYDAEAANPHYPDGKRGWWRYVDTGEVAGADLSVVDVPNAELFAFLDRIQAELPPPPTWRKP